MNLDKLKKRFGTARKRDLVIIMGNPGQQFSKVAEALHIYGIGVEYHQSAPADIIAIIESNISNRLWFIIEGSAYNDSAVAEFSMILRGRYPAVLTGSSNSLDASWKAEEQGYAAYFTEGGDVTRLTKVLLKGFGYIRTRASMIISLCNTTPDVNLSYHVFNNLKDSALLKSYSTLLINCDLANIYYDAELGVRANPQAVQHITRDGEELDAPSSHKLINKFNDHFDYISFNLLMDDIDVASTDSLVKGIDTFIDSVSGIYGFIFINLPYYLITSHSGLDLLANSDIRVLLTNSQIESIYNLNYLQERISFKKDNDGKSRDKLFCLRTPQQYSGLRITDGDIQSKLAMKVDFSGHLGGNHRFIPWLKKSNANLIDEIFR
ncbi:hypothetical protein HQN64_23880 [Enterobacteriaceae bacterium BIT-l23]|uniref:hypothetical protein n=1 Tax=Jejubacter sp. L23 TaxID=3092086 RepID=UPI0015852AA3|nr:hypothetical protein [Enterobacteriaceae bacterium BIT-l23]